MDTTYKIGTDSSNMRFEVSENGTLETWWSRNEGGYTVSPQEVLDFISWLTAHQNYFALAKTHEDQRRAMLADIAGVSEEQAQS